MGQLTVLQFDVLERAIIDGSRVAIYRRGTEFLVVPERIVVNNGVESLVARHPTTGAQLTIRLDEAERLELVR